MKHSGKINSIKAHPVPVKDSLNVEVSLNETLN